MKWQLETVEINTGFYDRVWKLHEHVVCSIKTCSRFHLSLLLLTDVHKFGVSTEPLVPFQVRMS